MFCLRKGAKTTRDYPLPASCSVNSLDDFLTDGNASFLRAARAGNIEKVLEYLKGNIDINTSNANGLNALHLAAKEGHVGVVTELLRKGANVNAATKKGNTALHIASLAGQDDVVKVLVNLGANVNVQSQNGFTPLYMAAQENHDAVVSFLLANGANQSLSTEDGFTPLAVALQQGHDKVVAVLLENDTKGRVRLPALHIAAKKDDCKAATLLLQNDHNPDVTSKSGFTPLHIAAHYGNDNIANILLDKGADVNYAAKHQITPLHVASKWGKSNMVALLIEKKAKIEASTRDGLTPLHCAARSGHDHVVDLLLEKGAPILAKTKNGLAPLHMASQGDHVDSARILLYHKAPVDDVTVDYLTALHVAAHCGHVKVAKLLLDRKADPNARALNGFTPLHIACKKNRIKVVELLLKHGASIEATTESGLTPLHVASFMGCMNIVIYLIQNGANPDVPTVRGETPLHLAARANQTDIIRILLRNGANVDAKAREEQTPLHIAARLGNVDIVSLLLQHGAAVDATTKDMYTALHIAAKEDQEEVASVLLDHGASLTSTTKKGFTPLHLAAKYGNIKVARLLLQKDAPVDAQGKNGVTPLHVAAHYDHVNVALLLLDKGASPHASAKNGYNPLHIAAKKNQMDIATTLLEYGAKCNAESKAGFTPLHLSSQEGHTDMTSLLIEHKGNVNCKANNGLTPLHLCAQDDRVNVASVLVKNGAEIGPQTKAGYTPLHVASHFGQMNMVRFLLQHNADVHMTTSHGYTPLHQAAQQGHTLIINLLLENKASPNVVTSQGQTALSIAQRLGYISVVETLKVVTETTVTTTTTTVTEEKYKVVAPETMQETFMTDSEDEGGEDTMLGDQSYRYLTADEMKSLGDDSLPIDVTKDEKQHESIHMIKDSAAPMVEEDNISPQHITPVEIGFSEKFSPDNVDISRAPVHAGFLVSFMVDARGGAMRGCRHSGVRVIIPPRKASMPMRITCRYLRKEKLVHPPPLMEGEACASRILEVGPVGARFLGPVIIEVPHFASLRGKEREVTILRSDCGETWREHTLEASEEAVQDVLNESFEGDELSALEDLNTNRITRILTTDFPQYFAIVTRIRQEVHGVGPEGGMVSSTVVPQVQAIFPEGALTKKIRVGLQAQPISPELVAKLLGNRVAVSPIVTVEPRRRKFHKPITLTIPVPQAATKGMINQYSGDAPTLRLLCSITGSTKSGGSSKAQWEDVTGSTPLTFVNDCVSFTTTVSARFWLMDCRQVNEATRFATELYQEAVHVPFMSKFVIFAKRHDPNEAQLRVFCMTDDKEDKTLETQEHFIEIAKSRDVEVLEEKLQYLEFAGNLVPVTNSGKQLKLAFQAFHENRLPFTIRVKDPHVEPMGRIAFMREPKVGRGEPPQTPICNLNVAMPDVAVSETSPVILELVTLEKKYDFMREAGLSKPEFIHRADLRLSDIARELDKDWVVLARQLDTSESDINLIKSEFSNDMAEQALTMLRLWLQKSGSRATGNELEKGLRKINREDIIKKCMFNVELVTDDVEKAVAKVHLDQSGFDVFKEELGSSREASMRRGTSLDVSYDEQDIMKEAESAAETSSETGSLFERDQISQAFSDDKENIPLVQEGRKSPKNDLNVLKNLYPLSEDKLSFNASNVKTNFIVINDAQKKEQLDDHNGDNIDQNDVKNFQDDFSLPIDDEYNTQTLFEIKKSEIISANHGYLITKTKTEDSLELTNHDKNSDIEEKENNYAPYSQVGDSNENEISNGVNCVSENTEIKMENFHNNNLYGYDDPQNHLINNEQNFPIKATISTDSIDSPKDNFEEANMFNLLDESNYEYTEVAELIEEKIDTDKPPEVSSKLKNQNLIEIVEIIEPETQQNHFEGIVKNNIRYEDSENLSVIHALEIESLIPDSKMFVTTQILDDENQVIYESEIEETLCSDTQVPDFVVADISSPHLDFNIKESHSEESVEPFSRTETNNTFEPQEIIHSSDISNKNKLLIDPEELSVQLIASKKNECEPDATADCSSNFFSKPKLIGQDDSFNNINEIAVSAEPFQNTAEETHSYDTNIKESSSNLQHFETMLFSDNVLFDKTTSSENLRETEDNKSSADCITKEGRIRRVSKTPPPSPAEIIDKAELKDEKVKDNLELQPEESMFKQVTTNLIKASGIIDIGGTAPIEIPEATPKLTESETWPSGEMDTSQVSVSSLPDDEKSEPTTATVSSATTAEVEAERFQETKKWTEVDESGTVKHVIQKTTHMTLSMQQKSDDASDEEGDQLEVIADGVSPESKVSSKAEIVAEVMPQMNSVSIAVHETSDEKGASKDMFCNLKPIQTSLGDRLDREIQESGDTGKIKEMFNTTKEINEECLEISFVPKEEISDVYLPSEVDSFLQKIEVLSMSEDGDNKMLTNTQDMLPEGFFRLVSSKTDITDSSQTEIHSELEPQHVNRFSLTEHTIDEQKSHIPLLPQEIASTLSEDIPKRLEYVAELKNESEKLYTIGLDDITETLKSSLDFTDGSKDKSDDVNKLEGTEESLAIDQGEIRQEVIEDIRLQISEPDSLFKTCKASAPELSEFTESKIDTLDQGEIMQDIIEDESLSVSSVFKTCDASAPQLSEFAVSKMDQDELILEVVGDTRLPISEPVLSAFEICKTPQLNQLAESKMETHTFVQEYPKIQDVIGADKDATTEPFNLLKMTIKENISVGDDESLPDDQLQIVETSTEHAQIKDTSGLSDNEDYYSTHSSNEISTTVPASVLGKLEDFKHEFEVQDNFMDETLPKGPFDDVATKVEDIRKMVIHSDSASSISETTITVITAERTLVKTSADVISDSVVVEDLKKGFVPLAFDNTAFVGADLIDASERAAEFRSRSPYEVVRGDLEIISYTNRQESSDVTTEADTADKLETTRYEGVTGPQEHNISISSYEILGQHGSIGDIEYYDTKRGQSYSKFQEVPQVFSQRDDAAQYAKEIVEGIKSEIRLRPILQHIPSEISEEDLVETEIYSPVSKYEFTMPESKEQILISDAKFLDSTETKIRSSDFGDSVGTFSMESGECSEGKTLLIEKDVIAEAREKIGASIEVDKHTLDHVMTNGIKISPESPAQSFITEIDEKYSKHMDSASYQGNVTDKTVTTKQFIGKEIQHHQERNGLEDSVCIKSKKFITDDLQSLQLSSDKITSVIKIKQTSVDTDIKNIPSSKVYVSIEKLDSMSNDKIDLNAAEGDTFKETDRLTSPESDTGVPSSPFEFISEAELSDNECKSEISDLQQYSQSFSKTEPIESQDSLLTATATFSQVSVDKTISGGSSKSDYKKEVRINTSTTSIHPAKTLKFESSKTDIDTIKEFCSTDSRTPVFENVEERTDHYQMNGPGEVEYKPEYDDDYLRVKSGSQTEAESYEYTKSEPSRIQIHSGSIFLEPDIQCEIATEEADDVLGAVGGLERKALQITDKYAVNISEQQFEDIKPEKLHYYGSVSDDTVDAEIGKILSLDAQLDEDIIERPQTPEPPEELQMPEESDKRLKSDICTESKLSHSSEVNLQANKIMKESGVIFQKTFSPMTVKEVITTAKVITLTDDIGHIAKEEFEIIDESELLITESVDTVHEVEGLKDFSTACLARTLDDSSQELDAAFSSPILPSSEGSEGSTGFVYGMQFERDLEDRSEEAMDIDSDQYSEEKEAAYTYGMRFEREHELEDEDIPCYGDLYTHQEEDEEAGEEGDKPKVVIGSKDYDTLAGRKFFTKSGEMDDVSMSSLQEFERLEEEIRSGRRSSVGSVDSFNGKQFHSKSGEHDDISMNSLTEFEKLERECSEAERVEAMVQEANARLSEIEEGHESQASEASQETFSETGRGEDSDSYHDYDTRFNEIGDIIKKVQTNVEAHTENLAIHMTDIISDKVDQNSAIRRTLETNITTDNIQCYADPETRLDSRKEVVGNINLDKYFTTEPKITECTKTKENELLDHTKSISEMLICETRQMKTESASKSPIVVTDTKFTTGISQECHHAYVVESKRGPYDVYVCKENYRYEDQDQDSLHEDQSMKPDSLSGDEKCEYQDSLHEDKSADVDSLQDELRDEMRDSLHEEKPIDDDSLHEMDILPDESSLSLESSLAAIVDVSHDSLSDKVDVHQITSEHDIDTDSLKGLNLGTALESVFITQNYGVTVIEQGRGDAMVSSTDSLEPSSSAATHATYQFETESLMSSSLNSVQTSEDYTMISSADALEPEMKISFQHGNSSMGDMHMLSKDADENVFIDSEGNIQTRDLKNLMDMESDIHKILKLKDKMGEVPSPEGVEVHTCTTTTNFIDDKKMIKHFKSQYGSDGNNFTDDAGEGFSFESSQQYDPDVEIEEVKTVDEHGNPKVIRRIKRVVRTHSHTYASASSPENVEEKLKEFLRQRVAGDNAGKGEEEIKEERTIDEKGNVVIVRTVQQQMISDPVIHTKSFTGLDAEKFSDEFVQRFQNVHPTENIEEYENIDEDGNIVRVTQQVVVKPEVRSLTFSGPDAHKQMEEYMKQWKEQSDDGLHDVGKSPGMSSTTQRHFMLTDSSQMSGCDSDGSQVLQDEKLPSQCVIKTVKVHEEPEYITRTKIVSSTSVQDLPIEQTIVYTTTSTTSTVGPTEMDSKKSSSDSLSHVKDPKDSQYQSP